MDIGSNSALNSYKAANLHVLTDYEEKLLNSVGDSLIAARKGHSKESVNICRILFRNSDSNLICKLNKLLVLCNEVCLAVDFYHRSNLICLIIICNNNALGGNAACLLGGGSKTLLTKNINGLVHIAVGLCESLLAVHHTCSGLFAESLYVFSSEVHYLSSSVSAASAASASPCSPCLPSMTASAIAAEIRRTARIASSLPGIT